MYLDGGGVQSHRPEFQWPHVHTNLSTPPLYMYVCCKSNPLPASGAHPLEVRSAAANTQADATLPRIGVRGGANRRITPGPHSQPFGGARQRWQIGSASPLIHNTHMSNTPTFLVRHLDKLETSAWERGVD